MLRPSMALAALLVTACLGAAASGKLAVQAQKRPAAAPQLAPTQLDYLVLASLADSQQLLSMAGYRLNQ
jgi:hypothetical protein